MPQATKSVPRDPREQFLTKNIRRGSVHLTPAAAKDLRFFAEKAVAGKPITFEGLRKWMREQHQLEFGRSSLQTAAKREGIEPWWSK